jgi:DNA-binding NarL/FixJ family response regulator
MTRIRVAIVDDQPLMRSGLRLTIEAEDDMTVVGEAGDGREAIQLTARAAPDVVLMDIQMPVLDGLAATDELLRRSQPPAIIVLTTFDRDEYVFEALRAGASGFLLKNAPPEDLVEAIRVVARGDALLAPAVTGRVIAEFARHRAPGPPDPALDQLTDRERQVLTHLATGATNTEIARAMILGEATVKTHVSSVLAKLGLRDRVQAVVYAYEHGLIEPRRG